MTIPLRVPISVVCPAHPVDEYEAPKLKRPYFTQLMCWLAQPQYLLALNDSPSLMLFDKSDLATPVRSLPTEQRITAITNINEPQLAIAGTSEGGYVSLWDPRASAAEGMRMQGPSGAPYLSLAASGTQLAVGTGLLDVDAMIDLWDLRKPSAPIWTYGDVHSDDIMTLAYHPDTARHANILLSGGMDGLVSTIDTTIEKEEDAVISVGNTDSSLACVGWANYPAGYVYTPTVQATDVGMSAEDTLLSTDPRRTHFGPVFAVSHMQTLSLWDADKFDCLVRDIEVRGPTSYKPEWATDYVVDASTSLPVAEPPAPDAIAVPMLVGDQEGGVALVSAQASLGAPTELAWTLEARLPSITTGPRGHADIVRSVAWDAAHRRLYTGGEDGKILAWAMDGSVANAVPSMPDAPDHAPTRQLHGRQLASSGAKPRFSPYR
ncbi:hypothetical protein MVES1_003052 [Malassezia vespertilionis]|uniref:Uncharacterized protein n=1 Tax=Malassezia vespertilionis TaxID=2020962 RepID=A0A2N1J976_9BASI|nr:uncharacterized protein MVES1_003052 [Malassezia vespertilionis]PKI83084.1 hypothetical protein MVES_002894 [Malassezia vespertilionis]WFD07683.1 hypothetical protein MVES1_003052 [Malassezia vespertilionis]